MIKLFNTLKTNIKEFFQNPTNRRIALGSVFTIMTVVTLIASIYNPLIIIVILGGALLVAVFGMLGIFCFVAANTVLEWFNL